MTLEARSKLTYETITNVSGTKTEDTQHVPAPADSLPPGDYIVVVLVVASSAPLHLHQAGVIGPPVLLLPGFQEVVALRNIRPRIWRNG